MLALLNFSDTDKAIFHFLIHFLRIIGIILSFNDISSYISFFLISYTNKCVGFLWILF